MNWEQRFLTFEVEAYEAMDELIGTTTKEYNRDIVTWESEQIYWGLIGNAEDRRNAREMIIKAKTEKEAKRAGDEYASCEKTRKRYKQEAKRRLELYDKFMEEKNDEADKH